MKNKPIQKVIHVSGYCIVLVSDSDEDYFRGMRNAKQAVVFGAFGTASAEISLTVSWSLAITQTDREELLTDS